MASAGRVTPDANRAVATAGECLEHQVLGRRLGIAELHERYNHASVVANYDRQGVCNAAAGVQRVDHHAPDLASCNRNSSNVWV